jgi:hypothetical protein
MDGIIGKPAPAYDGPPDYREVGRHGVFPEVTHDEVARLNFLAHMNRHLSTRVMPYIRAAWDARGAAAFEAKHGRPPADRHELRRALLAEPAFTSWSALRRMTMEQRQQAGRWVTLRQAEDLADRAHALTEGDPRLSLNPDLPLPRYVGAIDHHCMPGSYHTENFPGHHRRPARPLFRRRRPGRGAMDAPPHAGFRPQTHSGNRQHGRP